MKVNTTCTVQNVCSLKYHLGGLIVYFAYPLITAYYFI